MNILVDGRSWCRYSAGVSTFFTSAILEWATQRQNYIFHILLPKGLDNKIDLSRHPKNIILHDYSKRFPRKLPNIIILQLLVPVLCKKLHIDLYYSPVPHIPYFIPSIVKTIITVHDVVNIEMAHTMSLTNRMATACFFNKAITKADYLWANSYYTCFKVEEYFPTRCCKSIFVGGAVDRQVFYQRTLSDNNRMEIKRKYGIKNKFILFVGSLEPRKNLKFLLDIIPELYHKHQIQLVIVGGNGWKNSDIKDIVLSPSFPQKSTIFCGYINNEELASLYCCANCFVSAALMEGLGMPQIEALLCGCPIVTAHNTAMIEVAKGKEGAYTIEGYDTEIWKRTILNVINERPVVDPRQLADYDWRKIIKRLISYLQVI